MSDYLSLFLEACSHCSPWMLLESWSQASALARLGFWEPTAMNFQSHTLGLVMSQMAVGHGTCCGRLTLRR